MERWNSKLSKRITFYEFTSVNVLVRLCLRPIAFLRKGGITLSKNQNRTRNIQLITRVTKEEHDFIKDKMQQLGTNNFNAYSRKMLIDGKAINVNLTEFHTLANEVNKIGVNINQIVKLANETHSISEDKIDLLQKEVHEVWQLLKSSLSTLRLISR